MNPNLSYNALKMKTLPTQQEIHGLVAGDLERVEAELCSYAESPVEPIAEIGRYLIEAGGKRLRPTLLLLTARSLGEVSDATIRLAAVMELIHNATLIHDDVIDNADTRRGRPSARSHWGNPMTVLAGDWLYMQSFAMALRDRSFEVLNTLIEITQKMVEGELLQLALLGRTDVEERQLLEIVRCKTAYLFAGCTSIPGILAGLDHRKVQKLSDVGMNLGMAFQLVDDLLDLTSTEELAGKPVANDLKDGKVTLPVYYVLKRQLPEHEGQIEHLLKERGSVASKELLTLVQEVDGVRRTRTLAGDFTRKAVAELETFPPSVFKDAIVSIPEFILNRQA